MAKKNVRDEPLKPQVSENEQMSDIVFILDKMELILQAVSKIGKDGKYSTVPADKEHSNSFLKIDRYANMFENFVKNFWSQLKDPTRFGILSVKADTLDSPEVKQAIEDLAAGKQTKAVEDFLKKYEIVPRDKENQSINNQNQEEMAKKNETQQQATQGDGTQQPKYRYNESMINWEELKNFGLSREYLMERGLLDQMLRGYKTNQVVPISMNFGSAVLRTDARLSFQQSVGGPIVLGIQHPPETRTRTPVLRSHLLRRGQEEPVGDRQHGACGGTERAQRRIHPFFHQHRQAHQRGGRHARGKRLHPARNQRCETDRPGNQRPAGRQESVHRRHDFQ